MKPLLFAIALAAVCLPTPWYAWIFRSTVCYYHPTARYCPRRPPLSTFPSPPPTPTPTTSAAPNAGEEGM
jgi:hypothetical protein